MAIAEDAATVLEQFTHDAANLPAEIAHLYEEAMAKQDSINECNTLIANRDGQLQKWVKVSGSLVPHPKEEIFNKAILDAYDRAQRLQDEKIALMEKAGSLLDRQVKRLDIKLRDLQTDGIIPLDPQMPSLLRASPGNLVQADSTTTTGTNTPLQPLSINTGGSLNYAQAAINRLTNATAIGGRSTPTNTQPHPLQQSQLAKPPTINTAVVAVKERELSAGIDPKRRRLNASLGPLPPPSLTAVRHSSLGPGTPKATTPGVSRAGSVGPRPIKKINSGLKRPLVQQLSRKKLSSKGGISSKKARRLFGSTRASPSTTTGDESGESGSDEGEFGNENGTEDVDMEEAADDTKYCYCQDVSHGDMIACDNADCRIQWFHWSCTGITAEPDGEWLCRDCRKLPKNQIRKA